MGHGQMDENELAQVMLGFAQGEYDVLLCTTIIESGLDIPNVNTIIIDRADEPGLAQLYQLRGRVGRGANRAYAYLLLQASPDRRARAAAADDPGGLESGRGLSGGHARPGDPRGGRDPGRRAARPHRGHRL
jgi:transcription-repair coupling factor (superfamily II helicase)